MKYNLLIILICLLSVGCSSNYNSVIELEVYPDIFPDLTEVTLPYNISPLNFTVNEGSNGARVVIENEKSSIKINSKNGEITIPYRKWRRLLSDSKGGTLNFNVSIKKGGTWERYKSFPVYVSSEPIDKYIAYRLIPPGYELWSKMGIYQRNLENYDQSAIFENSLTGGSCVNCHSFPSQNPDKMLFHMRQIHPGTILVDNGEVKKLNTKTDETMSALVYPSWHPSGDYIAFSVNNTQQLFHQNHENRIEVYDLSSDVVVYDVNNYEIITSPELFSEGVFETFPTFSPDGKTIYYCTADSVEMPKQYQSVKYSLCSISFDPVSRTFGDKVDTLYNAKLNDKSVSFPRVSPDGKSLMFTVSDYGNFSIWHKESDLWLLDLSTKEYNPLDKLNSDDVESYHSWSSNSRWVVFSSRRLDGLYTRLYIAYMDEQGNPGKPFLLPQKNQNYYNESIYSYNIPEFITDKVEVSKREIARTAINDEGVNVTSSQYTQFPQAK
ncbi:MAG: hypothetical protein PHR52_10440 [Fermentimonas sp.]|nr:hypothetical protein [Fermentimonas sp.]